MQLERGFTGGFIVLGFAVFIAGFLTGMLAIAIISVESDTTAVVVMAFMLGLVIGLLATALGLVATKLVRSRRKRSLVLRKEGSRAIRGRFLLSLS